MSMLIALALLQAAPAAAACPPLPAGYAGWREVPAAPTELGAPLAVGMRTAEALTAAEKVRYLTKPDRAVTGSGSTARLTVPAAGNYAIVATEPIWIDVVQFGTRLTSATHRMGVPCTGMRKTVVFPLAAGEAVIQLWGGKAARVDLMVVPEH